MTQSISAITVQVCSTQVPPTSSMPHQLCHERLSLDLRHTIILLWELFRALEWPFEVGKGSEIHENPESA